mmetsp:Transcript_12205/g.21179  ORF Transcript_12205/g.21179 Transcript_12205/m.21179 type:complete len:224 (+) Transcript_12205:1046-1717(+)
MPASLLSSPFIAFISAQRATFRRHPSEAGLPKTAAALLATRTAAVICSRASLLHLLQERPACEPSPRFTTQPYPPMPSALPAERDSASVSFVVCVPLWAPGWVSVKVCDGASISDGHNATCGLLALPQRFPSHAMAISNINHTHFVAECTPLLTSLLLEYWCMRSDCNMCTYASQSIVHLVACDVRCLATFFSFVRRVLCWPSVYLPMRLFIRGPLVFWIECS